MSIEAVGSVGSFTPSGRLAEVVARTPLGEDKDGNRNIRVTYRTLEPEGTQRGTAKPTAADSARPTAADPGSPSNPTIPSNPAILTNPAIHSNPTGPSNPGGLGSDRPDGRSAGRGQPRSPQDLAPVDRARLDQLRGRDAQVRAEETAHTANAGDLAGPIQYVYQRGPDGRLYAIGGSVGISARASSGSPEELRRIGQRLTAAALAAINPSGADQSVARSGDAFRAYGNVEAFGGNAAGGEAGDPKRVSLEV